MTHVDLQGICEELHKCIELGPGDNHLAFRRVKGLLERITADNRSNTYVREKALSVQESFGVWFSPRRWNNARDGGNTAKQNIYTDIGKLENAVNADCDSQEGGA